MSNPRAICQVVTAASALEGADVTMDVSNALLFTVGQLVALYPPQYGDGSVLARAGQTVRYQITALAGAQLTGTLNTDDYDNPPQVERGWLVDGRDMASGGLGYLAGTSRASLQAAINAAAAAGGGIVDVLNDVTWDNTTISVPMSGNITIRGRGASAKLKCAPAGGCIMFTPVGGLTALNSTLAANVARGARSFSHNQTGGLTFAAGEYVHLLNPAANKSYAIIARVEAVAGAAPQTVTVNETIPTDFTTANGCYVNRMTMIPNLRFQDCYFDANGNTASTQAIAAYGLVDSAIDNCDFHGFNGAGVSGAAQHYYCLRPWVNNSRFIDCGSAGLAALQNYQSTRALSSNLLYVGGGFGHSELGSFYPTLRSVRASYCTGRSIGLGGPSVAPTFEFELADCHGDHAVGGGGTGYVGIDFRGGSAYGSLYGCGGLGNGSSGFWTEGFGEHDIRDYGGEYANNGWVAGAADIALSLTTYNIEFWGTRFGTIGDLGTGNKVNNSLYQYGGSAVVNNATEQITFTKLIGAGALSLVNALRLTFAGAIDNNAGNRTVAIAVKYGATTLWKDTTANIAASGGASIYRPFFMTLLLRNQGATNSQALNGQLVIGGVGATNGFGDIGAAGAIPAAPIYGNAAEDSTVAKTLVITVTMSAADFSFLPTAAILEVVG